MRIFKTLLVSSLAILSFTGFAVAATGKTGNVAFPVLESDYKAYPTLALIGGTYTPADEDVDAASGFGVELSLDCPAYQSATGRVRQQISFMQYEKSELTVNSIEFNPHLVYAIQEGLEVGAGPGLGYVMADLNGSKKNYWAIQAGASLHYRFGDRYFAGAEVRYQFTDQQDLNGDGKKSDFNNRRIMGKIGMNF